MDSFCGMIATTNESQQQTSHSSLNLLDDLAITGVSCRLPKSNNIGEFAKNLEDSVDMVAVDDSRFPAGSHNTPARFGKIPDYKHFDAFFFQVFRIA